MAGAHHSAKETKAAAAEAKSKLTKEGRKEDAYELAISFTKEGDFPSWYSDVSLICSEMTVNTWLIRAGWE